MLNGIKTIQEIDAEREELVRKRERAMIQFDKLDREIADLNAQIQHLNIQEERIKAL